MELIEALRTTGAVRAFTDDEVSDDVLWRVLDTARFAPSGSNMQGWRVVSIREPAARRRLRELYLDAWYEYLAMIEAGIRPWAPSNDRAAEAEAIATAPAQREAAAAGVTGFAERFDDVPALLTVWVDLGALAAVDRDHDRYTFAGGASVYPFVWNLLLAAHQEGLGGVITTMSVRHEAEVADLVAAPPNHALAAVVALGYPHDARPTLRRSPVESFATTDRFGGAPIRPTRP